MANQMQKLWGGRFSKDNHTSIDMSRLNSSLPIDYRLFKEDIQGSIAYAVSLSKVGLLNNQELDLMICGLKTLLKEWESGEMIKVLDADILEEDIHSVNERRLGEIIGTEVSGKLHTGRSRNDQVVTDMRLWLRSAVKTLSNTLITLIQSISTKAEKEIDLIMPGYTHLQRAQPIRWSHFLMSHVTSLFYSLQRLQNLFAQEHCEIQACPLGSGALAGNPFGIDRNLLSHDLSFIHPTMNSMNAVSSRDYVLDFLHCCSMIGQNLSRLSEDLIIYASSEFSMVSLSETYSTGSSLMPQKKNPDSLELIRGKSGYLFGLMSGLMMTCKGLPSTYNKDLQDDKRTMFEAFDMTVLILKVMNGVISTLKANPDAMRSNLSQDMLSTDLADEMVRNGIPFREAHHKSGQLVAMAEVKKVQLSQLSLDEYRSVWKGFGEEITSDTWWSFEASVERRNCIGGTSRERVLEQIKRVKELLKLE